LTVRLELDWFNQSSSGYPYSASRKGNERGLTEGFVRSLASPCGTEEDPAI